MKKLLFVFLLAVFAFAEEGKDAVAVKPEKEFFQLDDIVVTGSRVEKALYESPGSLAIVDEDKIKAGGDKNAGYAVSEISGVDSCKVGFTGQTQNVMIRGVSSEGTLVLLNGVPLKSSYQGLVDLSSINLDNVERVEILKGPASSLYGAGAVGGVINVITRDKVTVPSLDLTALYGTFETKDLRLAYSDNISGVSLNLAGSFFQTEGARANSKAISKDLNGSVAYSFEKNHNIRMTFSAYKCDSGAPGSVIVFNPLNNQQIEKANLGFDYRLPLGEDADLKFKVYGMKNILNFHASTYETLSEERNFFTEAAYTYDFGGINIITLGISGDYGVLDQSSIGSRNAATRSLFAQDIFDLLGSWIFTASARYDSHTLYGDTFNPMFALIYNIDDGVQLKGSYGTSFRAPTFSDIYWPYQSDPDWFDPTKTVITKGNTSLVPEKANSWEAGLNLEFGRNATLRTTYFNNKIRDLIQWASAVDSTGNVTTWTPSNVGEAEMYGVEAELKVVPAENLNTFISYTWLKATDLTANTPLIYRANNKANVGVSYKMSGSKLSLNSEYYDVRPNGDSTAMLPSFITLNAKVNVMVTKEVSLLFSVDNILDTAYEFRENYPMPGRTFNGGMKLSF
ncbi:MAG: TonB-dependent receptor [Candidatus Firestonebacteria bacterium]